MYMHPGNVMSIQEMSTLSRKTSFQALEQCLLWIFEIKTSSHWDVKTSFKEMFSWHVWLSVFRFLTCTDIAEMTFLYFKAAFFVSNIVDKKCILAYTKNIKFNL